MTTQQLNAIEEIINREGEPEASWWYDTVLQLIAEVRALEYLLERVAGRQMILASAAWKDTPGHGSP